MNKGYETYKQTNTMAMSQLDLILTVYRGAIRFVRQAKSDFEEDHLSEGRIACEKARKCIVHLYTTLDMEKGEEVAENLGRLYAYIIEQLDLAMASKSQDLLNEIIRLLETIKEGWDGIKDQNIDNNTHEREKEHVPASTELSDADGTNSVEEMPVKQRLTVSA